MDSYTIIKHPVSTEKAMRLMEAENKLIFVVDNKATKSGIKAAAEEIFKATVVKVNTLVTNKGVKRAYIKFGGDTLAIDIATQMGLM